MGLKIKGNGQIKNLKLLFHFILFQVKNSSETEMKIETNKNRKIVNLKL